MALIRDIGRDPVRRATIRRILEVCNESSTRAIAEGVETRAELAVLQSFGIDLLHGFGFDRQAFEALSVVAAGVSGSSSST